MREENQLALYIWANTRQYNFYTGASEMTVRDIIERRIYLKKQLIFLVRREIKSLQKELENLKLDDMQSGHEAKGGKG